MSDAELEKTVININISTRSEKFIASGEVVLFDGFLKVYMESTDDEQEEGGEYLLPPLAKGMNLDLSLAPYKKTNSKWIMDLNAKHKL